MSDLRSLAYTASKIASSTNVVREFVVYNSSNTINNGGCCCLWTVPAGTTFVTFEAWGGGGNGGGACCCMQGYRGGGAGAYSLKTVYCNGASLAGTQFSICAAGSTCASPGTTGYGGNTSYVTGTGLSNFCAVGGFYGQSVCFYYGSCYVCQIQCCCSQHYGGDIGFPGYSGSGIGTTFCYHHGQQFVAVAPATVSGPLNGPDGCMVMGCAFGANLPFGAGGWTSHVYGGGCCCGHWGQQGLVSVTYG